jgi:hypothetical protein
MPVSLLQFKHILDVELIKNNAALGADIAVALFKSKADEESKDP